MEELSSLAALDIGESGVISQIELSGAMQRRLAAFGLIEGTDIECVMRAPGGEPSAYRVRGATLALRRRDCERIHLQKNAAQSCENGITVVLAGNPNVGKSTVFNALTGMRQHTGNWCGKTVESAKGKFTYQGHEITLLDTPGTYSLLSDTAEERAARDTLCNVDYDCVLCVCDATRLERGLILALQITEMTNKAVLCINCMDAAKQQGIEIDIKRISQMLGIPVIAVTARQKRSLEPLMEAVMERAAMLRASGTEIRYPQIAERSITKVIEPIAATLPAERRHLARWLAVHLLMPDAQMPLWADAEKMQFVEEGIHQGRALLHEGKTTAKQYEKLVAATVILRASSICAKVVVQSSKAKQKEYRIDRVVTSKRYGWGIMAVLLFVVFWLTASAANVPSALLFDALEHGCNVLSILAAEWKLPHCFSGALIDGALRGTCRVISVMLPPMAIFFPLFTLLEDSGLLPRIAFNADSAFARCHACGKQSLTMAMGFGCNAVGVTECRIIASPRERLIAIFTNSFVPCNGRFPCRLGNTSHRKDDLHDWNPRKAVYQKSYGLPRFTGAERLWYALLRAGNCTESLAGYCENDCRNFQWFGGSGCGCCQ